MFEIPIRVDYVDTDAMGVVHHASYCRWLERARILWLESIDQSYKRMEEEGLALPVRELEVKYRIPMRFDDRALVTISGVDMGRHTIEIHYRILSSDKGDTIAVARTKHVLVRVSREHLTDVEFLLIDVPQTWRDKWQRLKDQK